MKAVLASLGAFAASAVRPRTPLARAIVTVLAIKLVAIVAIKILMFPGDGRPVVDEAAMMRLLGAPPAVHDTAATNLGQ